MMEPGINEERSGLDTDSARKQVTMLQCFQVGIVCSMILFMVVAFQAFSFGEPTDEMSRDEEASRMRTMYTMSLVNAGMAFVGYLLAWAVPGRLVNIPKRFARSIAAEPEPQPDSSHADTFLKYFTTVRIIRLAMIEGPAFFAGIACIIGGSDLTAKYPAIWLNLIPAGIFLLYGIAAFPTRGRLKDIFEEQMAHARRLAEQGV